MTSPDDAKDDAQPSVAGGPAERHGSDPAALSGPYSHAEDRSAAGVVAAVLAALSSSRRRW